LKTVVFQTVLINKLQSERYSYQLSTSISCRDIVFIVYRVNKNVHKTAIHNTHFLQTLLFSIPANGVISQPFDGGARGATAFPKFNEKS
jgi:hypothetical protein